jgi:hypothetical protein
MYAAQIGAKKLARRAPCACAAGALQRPHERPRAPHTPGLHCALQDGDGAQVGSSCGLLGGWLRLTVRYLYLVAFIFNTDKE